MQIRELGLVESFPMPWNHPRGRLPSEGPIILPFQGAELQYPRWEKLVRSRDTQLVNPRTFLLQYPVQSPRRQVNQLPAQRLSVVSAAVNLDISGKIAGMPPDFADPDGAREE